MASPRAVPRTVPRMVASGPMIKMSRAPTMSRDSTSRPSGSVPNQCAPDGAALVASNCWASGLSGAIACPKMAHTIQNTMMAAPARNVALRTSSRHWAGVARAATATAAAEPGPSVVPDGSSGSAATSVIAAPDPQPRVERDQQQVRAQRGHHVDHPDDQDPGLQHGEVLTLGGLEDQVPDPLVVEQPLHHYQPADQVPGLGRDDRDGGQQRVPQDVPADHRRPRQSLQDRGARVIRVQRLDGPRPGHTGNVSEKDKDEWYSRQYQVPELAPHARARPGRGGHRQHLELHPE